MKLARASWKMGMVALWVIAGTHAMAQDRGWYAGFNIGQSRASIDDVRITSNLLGHGFYVSSLTEDDRDNAFKIFGGYQLNRYLSFEAGYFDLGAFGFHAVTVPSGTLDGTIKLNGINLDAVLNIPFTRKFSLFGRVGVNYAEAKDTFRGTGMVNVLQPNPSHRTSSLKFGGGLQYDFTRSFGMRAEAERYRIDDAVGNQGDIDMASLGLLFRFGRHAPEPPPPWSPPPQVVPVAPVPDPPPPPPKLVVVPIPVFTQQYCTILDLQFEVNVAEIQRDDLEKLSVVGTFLTKYPDTTAVIEGHTDNIGGYDHNMKLSQSRAEHVMNYLVTTLRIAPSRLTAVGYGDSRPIGDNLTEEGKRANRRIGAVIACATDISGLPVVPARITMAMLLEFDQTSTFIRPEYNGELQKVANYLKANPTATATVEGHTGNLQATPKLAMEISQKRAQSVVDYLVDNFGVARSRLTAEGFGRNRRTAYNTSAEGRQENRRVNIVFNYPKK